MEVNYTEGKARSCHQTEGVRLLSIQRDTVTDGVGLTVRINGVTATVRGAVTTRVIVAFGSASNNESKSNSESVRQSNSDNMSNSKKDCDTKSNSESECESNKDSESHSKRNSTCGTKVNGK